MYAADNDDHCPPANKWMDAILPYTNTKSLFHDPMLKDKKSDEFGYAFFRPMSQVKVSLVENAEEVPLVFQSSDHRWNANGNISLLRDPKENQGGFCVAFANGHARYMRGPWPEKPIHIKTGGPKK